MSDDGTTTPPAITYIGSFTLRLFLTHEASRFEVEVPECQSRFSSTTLPAALANCLQGLIYILHEEQTRQALLRPAIPRHV